MLSGSPARWSRRIFWARVDGVTAMACLAHSRFLSRKIKDGTSEAPSARVFGPRRMASSAGSTESPPHFVSGIFLAGCGPAGRSRGRKPSPGTGTHRRSGQLRSHPSSPGWPARGCCGCAADARCQSFPFAIMFIGSVTFGLLDWRDPCRCKRRLQPLERHARAFATLSGIGRAPVNAPKLLQTPLRQRRTG